MSKVWCVCEMDAGSPDNPIIHGRFLHKVNAEKAIQEAESNTRCEIPFFLQEIKYEPYMIIEDAP